MKRLASLLLLAASALLLSACGFHLKGLGGQVRPLPFSSVYLETGNAQIAGALHDELARNPQLTIAGSPQQAEAVVAVVDEGQSKDVGTINSGGKVNEYQLTYRAVVRVTMGGAELGPDLQVVVRRNMNYSDSDVLGKEQEEASLWADARRDAAEQIARRLSYLKRPAGMSPSGPQSLKPNAATQP
ncbi:LPS assembly lipoprotein LptE [uncultured Aquitalea sp.]|uniref:LPS-assembly lipoprotein LptE n=1 Tax=uncultured Aquitalea sp. TaxID=540272 RepID=UPI0025FDE393|nr:LPS assembly lipoprotein LptE [uncultured Aquitalea sp.]